MNRSTWCAIGAGALSAVLLTGCFFSAVPIKQYYVLNYLPSTNRDRLNPAPYPATIRLRDFGIEEAYNRPQIVYRQSPFQLQYYYYRVWAVKPSRMITDLVYKHLLTSGLVSSVIRRFDEGPRPEFELSGVIEALDEYDSDELWFAHIAMRINLQRVSDGSSIYTRRFDLRKRVYEHKPENVIREMSSLMEFILTQVVRDLDLKLAHEYGIAVPSADSAAAGAAPDAAQTGEVK
jgi:ABC-type uncharacterized transport system auxiliary subunit